MQFNLIGPFQITTDDGREYAPNAPKICQMLALLALQPGEAAATDSLILELWEGTLRAAPCAPCRPTSTTRARC